MIEVGQARGARAGSRQRVGLGDRQLLQQCVAVSVGVRPVAGGLPAIAGGLHAIGRGPGSSLDRGGAVGSGSVAVLGAAPRDRLALPRASVIGPSSFARHQLAIALRGGQIARQRPQVASVRNRIASSGSVEPLLSAIVALSCALARRLIALGERLIVLENLGTRADAFLRLLDRPVRGSVHATIG